MQVLEKYAYQPFFTTPTIPITDINLQLIVVDCSAQNFECASTNGESSKKVHLKNKMQTFQCSLCTINFFFCVYVK